MFERRPFRREGERRSVAIPPSQRTLSVQCWDKPPSSPVRHDAHVATRSSRLHDARTLSRQIRIEVGREIRSARQSAGGSLQEAGARTGMSHAQLSRIERGVLEHVTVDQLARGCAAVGLRLWVRAVPGAGPALDGPQLELIGRLRARLPADVRVRTEVPLPAPGDPRAWDCVLGLSPTNTPVEAEARLRDIQALERRFALKRRDGRVDILVLLVSDTAHNRSVLALHREALRDSFPLDTRQMMAFLRVGRTPMASGIVVL
jgi:transcriptional regulator with XRE-family HTH domain